MLDSIYVYTDQWDQYVDMLESAFRQVNLPFFFRIGFEFNGSWNPYHPYIYPLAFRQLVIDLNSRGIDNFATVWCYEPDAAADFADSTEQGWKWYPGDDVVDWFGLDLFTVEHFHPDLPDSAQGRTGWDITRKGRSEAFLRFAEVRGKPVYLNELSSIHTVSTPDSLDPEGIDGQADWDAWFEPFFRFIQAHPNIKGWNYIDVDWSSINSYQQQGWRDARLEINSILRRRWVHQMSSGNVIHAGCRLDSMTEAPALPPLVPTKLSLTTYPNPFNSLLTIRITPVRSAATAAAVFTLDGRRLWEQTFPPSAGSEFAVIWDGSKAAAGLYLIRVASGNSMTLRKALLLR